ncbi:MAG: riboflavin biosynthesis protein RibF [Alphaproteobacteria bacterium]|jgi:riboflavin kinase/FMN adenylyltransferase|nr:riboflavin biosynthesis protein RibF [Alphaproteobacteria bacterium]
MDNLVLAIGNFDGVHYGHQKIIAEVKNLAESINLKDSWGVMFFDPHPKTALNGYKKFMLTTVSQRIDLLKDLNVPNVLVVPFVEVQNLTAEEFFKDILLERYHVKGLVTGSNFNFGKEAKGDSNLMVKLSQDNGVKYICLEKQMYNKEMAYSSTNIRNFINEGNIIEANKFLGHSFKVSATVLHGNKIGRTIGFPTANLSIENYIAPKFGVYVVYAYVDGKKHQAIANFGLRPSVVVEKNELLEVHLFNFNEDIYSKNIEVEFMDFIRAETKFASIEELKAQIEKDKQFAVNYFNKIN